MRQAFFALFEVEAHELIGKGASTEELSKRYYANLEKQFGDAVEVSEDFRWEWVAIPHIYEVPFYVYAYAFGQLLVLALFHQYQTEGSSFVPRFVRILSAGGSASPAKILSRAGIRIDRESFWQGGFRPVGPAIGSTALAPALRPDDPDHAIFRWFFHFVIRL